MSSRPSFFSSALFLLLGTVLLVGCSNSKINKDDEILTRRDRKYRDMEKLFGDDTLLFGGDSDVKKEADIGIGVNSYLWRASLDTLSFMPLKSVDPFGGVILTKWYTPVETPQERIKVDIRILDRQLRADGVKVSVFRQTLVKGNWVDQPTDHQTAVDLENSILTRARQLRIQAGK